MAAVSAISFFTLLLSPFSIKAQEGEQDIWSVKDALGQTATSANQRQIEVEQGVVKGEAGNVNSDSQLQNTISAAQAISNANLLGATTDSLEAQAIYGPGAVKMIAGLVDNMYDYQPASSQRYVAYLLNSAKIPVAQAQGIGASSLDPIMGIWTTFRNLAYYLFVLMFLVIGILIMFRHKINGQTVVTVQQAIPNIIVALIFVTFSYAIGGLLIDIMYLVMSFIAGIFTNSTSIMSSNIFSLGTQYVTGGFTQTNEAINAIIAQVSGDNIISGLGGLTVGFIMAIALLYGIVKLFIELLKSYVSVILLITFSPVILMMGAIPGQNSFGSWIKNLVGNLAAFPVVLLVLVVSEAINAHGITAGGFAPPFLLGPTVSGGVGGGGGNALAGLVGIGMLLTTPEIVKKAKEALGAKEGVMGELAGAAWGRFKQGAEGINKYALKPAAQVVKVGGGMGIGAGLGAAGGVLGSDLTGKFDRATGAKYGALAGAGASLLGGPIKGPRKIIGTAGKALNTYGEFAENLQYTGVDFMSPVEDMIEEAGMRATLKGGKWSGKAGSVAVKIANQLRNNRVNRHLPVNSRITEEDRTKHRESLKQASLNNQTDEVMRGNGPSTTPAAPEKGDDSFDRN